MKVLFVYPNVHAQIGFNYGLACISAILKKHGHSTSLLNLNEKLNKLPSDEGLRRYIEDYDPGLIGFSVVTPQYPTALRIARLIRGFSDVPILIGGVHSTLAPEEVLKEGCFDYACVGEGEEAVLELVTKLGLGEDTTSIPNIWAKRDGKVMQNNVRPFVDLSRLPRKDYELFDYQRMLEAEDGWARLMASRGCPYRCSYCFNHKIVDRYRKETGASIGELGYIRRHPLEEILSEIDYLLHTYQGIKMFIFDDDIFTFDKEYLRSFSTRYAKLTRMPFVVNAHVRVFDEERAKMLKEAGCAIVKFGLESGSERIRREVLERPMSNEEILHAFKVAHQYGLHTSAFVMIGLPYETKEDILSTVGLLGKIRPGRFRWAIFYPFPRTEAYEMSLRGGYLDLNKMKGLENFFEASCLDFGPEHNLLISKLQKTFPWYVNTCSKNSIGKLYSFLTEVIEEMPKDAWEEVKGSIPSLDMELSQCLLKANCEHYAFRYNTFTAVRSDWIDAKGE